MRILLATKNNDKIREIRRLLEGIPQELLTYSEVPRFPDVEEDGQTIEENAIKKALHISRATGLPALADDSGLEVDALDGQPGVHSARFAGQSASYADNNRRLLELLSGIPADRRTARFVCVAALALPDGSVITRRGTCEGRITSRPEGSGDFGYDPLFFHPPSGKTFAELSPLEKNAVSHRRFAFHQMKGVLEDLLRG